MKHFSLKIIILCLVAPPLVYLVAMHYLERYLNAKYHTEIEAIYIGDTAPLFEGAKSLKEAVNENVDGYLAEDFLVSGGVNVGVTVVTRQGVLFYPATILNEDTDGHPGNPIEVAAENYALLSQGLNLRVAVSLNQNTLPANLLLAALILAAALVLYFHYRAGVRMAVDDAAETQKKLDRLHAQGETYAAQLNSIAREREALTAKFTATQEKLAVEKEKSERNEEDLIEEIVGLEKEMEQNLSEQELQQALINDLKEKVADLELQRGAGDRAKKTGTTLQKRFETLYKNAAFSKKAVGGYNRLPADLQLKGEEVIHQLNEDAGKVKIKRKVFGKKNRETVFEVIFGYKGRLYFRRLKDNRVEVLSIGTKNTQRKDLEFLDKL